MNPVIDAIKCHRSIRNYKPDPIPDTLLTNLLEAGLRASSSGNMQCYSVIVSTAPKQKEALYELHFNQEMVKQAPVILTFCADFHRMRKWLKTSNAPDNFDNFMSFMIGAIDATIAAQTVAIAAESEGLGVCYMGTTLANCEKIGKFLDCPENVVPVVGYTLGYPDETPDLRDRLPLNSLVHYERYEDHSPETVSEHYREKELRGWLRYQSNEKLKDLIEKSGVKNLAQVYTQLKYSKESHIEFSETVLSYLKQQSFF